MINFKPILLSDKKAIDACLSGNTYRACDFCFANIFAWQIKFKTTFSIIQDTLFIRYQDDSGALCYTIPVGKMPLQKSLPMIIQDAEKNNIPLKMKGVTVQMWNEIQEVMPDFFRFSLDHANNEYIYLSEKLITLKGKKLQSKRNHINRFKKDYPDWHYFTLSSHKELNECIEMLDKWEKFNLDKADESSHYDYLATKTMLENFDALELRGGYIRVNGKIIAFTLGEPLTDDTFVIHAEKAFGEMHGAYTIINQQFIENEASAYKYINREEDMGIENLRKAKESYYPDILLQERIVTRV